MKKTSKVELLLATAKGLVGSIPFVGPVAAEVSGTLLPNPRHDKAEAELVGLHSRVERLEAFQPKPTYLLFYQPVNSNSIVSADLSWWIVAVAAHTESEASEIANRYIAANTNSNVTMKSDACFVMSREQAEQNEQFLKLFEACQKAGFSAVKMIVESSPRPFIVNVLQTFD